jgi:hypothetical protein
MEAGTVGIMRRCITKGRTDMGGTGRSEGVVAAERGVAEMWAGAARPRAAAEEVQVGAALVAFGVAFDTRIEFRFGRAI